MRIATTKRNEETTPDYLSEIPEVRKAAEALLNHIVHRVEEREGRTPTPDEVETKAIAIVKGQRRD